MSFNTSGFVVGLLVARQQNLPPSAAITIGAATSAMGGMNAMGIVVATALAQRQAPATPQTAVAVTTAVSKLPAPGLLTAKVEGGGNDRVVVALQWERVEGASGYRIARAHKRELPRVLATVSDRTQHFMDPLDPGAEPKNYTYTVVALDGTGVAGAPATVQPKPIGS